MTAEPDFLYSDLLPVGADETPYRLLTTDGVSTLEAGARTFLQVDPEVIRMLTAEAMHDISHYLRPAHLTQLRTIIDDPESSGNDRFVALDLLKNANISAGGVLPMCQDTGTAIVMGKKCERVLTGGGDAECAQPRRLRRLHQAQPPLLADGPADDVGRAEHRLEPPSPDRAYSTPRARRTPYNFLFMAKGGGSANKSFLFQETKAILNPAAHARLPRREDPLPRHGCLPAVPPRGGHWRHQRRVRAQDREVRLRPLPRQPAHLWQPVGHGFRDLELEEEIFKLTQSFGIGAQFGGKYFCHDVRVIRLPRHGASCPVAIAVSCSADRQALGKITAEGVFLEQLERDPGHYLPDATEEHL